MSPATVLVVMMFLGYAVSFMDRQIVSVLVEPIHEGTELRLSDGQVGVLTGLSFALFYCAMSLPIAALADRYSRKRIIVIAMAFWSVMTALFGLADTYTELFLARMGVGIGEAAFAPAAFLDDRGLCAGRKALARRRPRRRRVDGGHHDRPHGRRLRHAAGRLAHGDARGFRAGGFSLRSLSGSSFASRNEARAAAQC